MTSRHWLRVLLYQDLPGVWMARSLEHDIAVEGPTTDAAVTWILRIISAHIDFDQRHGRPPLSAFPEAPQRYWQAFAAATRLKSITPHGDAATDGSDHAILVALTLERPSNLSAKPAILDLARPGYFPSHTARRADLSN